MSRDAMLSSILNRYSFISVKDVTDFLDTILLIIPVSNISSVATPNFITKRQISTLVRKIQEALDVKVLISYSAFADKDNIELALKALSRANLKKGKISDLDLSFIDSQNAILNVFSKNLSMQERTDWENLVKALLSGFNINVSSFLYEEKNNPEPTMMVILRAAKKLQPFNINQLQKSIEDNSYHIQSSEWLNSKLDNLRKKGFILRDQHGVYRMTLAGLEIVPVTKSRQSSDIDRMLYLARKYL
ncbi:hypothetical protein [Citrobacter koseri]|uniref:hypothetical protein n=1 Tax=Citrobacter koseri TaxID=545 RepID=UPI002941D53E|nr:hypothetical protein [Citrobacter koseri]MEB2702632.1 hypothetical protein [Citrobacter koseri]MEB2708222.1 hypothetical protein [Citrobacter koseri]MEB2770678.1 hypothetical protein [Citrobacter koseri]WOJ28001.1 hypothetical protein R1221_09300 [Citrobacter koseri]